MYAVIQNGAHQYRIQLGQFVKMEKLDLAPGKLWKCGQVLALQNSEGQLMTGAPYIEKAEVSGRVIRHGKSKKVLVFKKKRRKGYRRTQGHRQEFTEIYIEALSTPSGEKMKKKLSSSLKKVEHKKTSVSKKQKVSPSVKTKKEK